MILGLSGILMIPFTMAFLVPIIVPIAAVVFGHVAHGQLKRNPTQTGNGMMLTGLITGYIVLGMAVLMAILIIVMLLIFGSLLSLPGFMNFS
ncbi:hypothetical protein FM104_04395 [Microbacterium esteraromaticum]|uniref:DUF4190 domain-containing protein n=2 Tax=Microbacterium esteraromaticum TaxID=57043 RepID=A0A1R4IWA7_9MICO|nr:hypothetical protein FM104_04395 [Microbacterium esteraromaticum]